MDKRGLYQISFQLILHSGNAKSSAMEGLYLAKEKQFEEAENKLKEAGEELLQAHKFQTELIQAEAGGTEYEFALILIHAQDHLMTAMTFRDLAKEFIDLRKELFHQ